MRPSFGELIGLVTELSTHHNQDYEFKAINSVEPNALRGLYEAVGWVAYTQEPDTLVAALEGSSFVAGAFQGGALIGLIRVVSDDASIAYIQDILVHPEHQRRGVGRALMGIMLERYEHVRQKILLTDGRPDQLQFYESLGFTNTRSLVKNPLNAFVMFEGCELS